MKRERNEGREGERERERERSMWTVGNKEKTASKEVMLDANDLLEMKGILGPNIDGLV